jgi:hypothetical protein
MYTYLRKCTINTDKLIHKNTYLHVPKNPLPVSPSHNPVAHIEGEVHPCIYPVSIEIFILIRTF